MTQDRFEEPEVMTAPGYESTGSKFRFMVRILFGFVVVATTIILCDCWGAMRAKLGLRDDWQRRSAWYDRLAQRWITDEQ